MYEKIIKIDDYLKKISAPIGIILPKSTVPIGEILLFCSDAMPSEAFSASLLDNAGVDIGAIQQILGHQNRETTEIYLQRLSPMERKAIEENDQVFDFKLVRRSGRVSELLSLSRE